MSKNEEKMNEILLSAIESQCKMIEMAVTTRARNKTGTSGTPRGIKMTTGSPNAAQHNHSVP